MADEETVVNEQETDQVDERVDEHVDEKVDEQVGEETEEKSEQDKLKESIEVDTEDIGALRKKLSITIPRDAIDERLDGQYGELTRDALIPGFRKGRAPRRLVEKRFGTEVNEQVVTGLVGNSFLAAVEKEDLKVVGDPEIWVKTADKDIDKDTDKDQDQKVDRLLPVDQAMALLELPEEGPMTFACEIEVRPEFELPELEGIPLQKPNVEISDEDVTSQVERVLASRGTYAPVEDGVIQENDLTIADMKITCEDTVLREEKNVQVAARPQQVGNVVLRNLGEALIGKKSGETATTDGELPDDYEKAEFRGKKASFEFTIHEIKRLRLPELSDDLLSSIGFESEDDFRNWVRGDMESRLDQTLKQAMRGQVHKYLLDNVKLDLPEGLSTRQVNRAVARKMVDLYRQGVPEAEIDKHMDELKTGAQEQALTELRLQFIMDKVAEELKVEVGEDEVNGAIASIARMQNQRFDRIRDDLAARGGLNTLATEIRNEKIVDQLISDAKIVETEGPTGDEEKTEKKTKKSAKKTTKKKKPKRMPPSKQADKGEDDALDAT